MHSKDVVSGVFTLCFLSAKCILYLDAKKKKKKKNFLFLCELSHQQRNNISGLAARYNIYGLNAHKEIIILILCSSQYKIHVAVAVGGNAA